MKKLSVSLIFLGLVITSSAQIKSGGEKKLNSVSSENRTTISVQQPSIEYPITVDSGPSDVQKLESIKSTIQAIEEKIAYVKADEKLDFKAKQADWYSRMETTLATLREEQTKLEKTTAK
jgi:hypothetical protein